MKTNGLRQNVQNIYAPKFAMFTKIMINNSRCNQTWTDEI